MSSKERGGLFVTEDGQNLAFTFALVCSLFFLWAMCNGMIDVMDKHFQDELGLDEIAVGLGAVRALSGLLPDVHAGRDSGEQTRVQARHHHGAG